MNAKVNFEGLNQAQPKNPIPKEYDAGDMADAHNLAKADLNWASHAIYELKNKLNELKERLHKDHGIHDLYFEGISTSFHMYEYLIDDRKYHHKDEAEKYKARIEELRTGNKPKPDHGQAA